jgi:hypothetical protein
VKPVDPVLVIRLKGDLKRYEKAIYEQSKQIYHLEAQAASLDSERECNRILTDEVERLQMALGNADLDGTLNGYTGKLRWNVGMNKHGFRSEPRLQQEFRNSDGIISWEDVDIVTIKDDENDFLVDND